MVDIAQLLLASVKRPVTQPAGADAAAPAGDVTADTPTDEVATGTPMPDEDNAPDAAQSATQPAEAGENTSVAGTDEGSRPGRDESGKG